MPVRSAWIHIALLAGYVVLATIHTFPLVLHLDTHLPGQGIGDNASFMWNLWWMREALASSSVSFFTNPMIEAPLGGSMVLHTHTALSGFAAATLLAPLSVVAAQNIVIIVSLALNGLATYVLSRTASAARGPAILAGALFVVTPPITARLMGHFDLVLVWPLAFACAAYLRWWRTPRLWTAMLLAATAALIPYSNYYYAVFFGLFAIAYAASQIWQARFDIHRGSATWTSTLLFALAGIAAVIAAVIALSPAFELRIAGARISVSTPTNAMTAAWLLAIAAAVVRWRPRVRLTRRDSAIAAHVRSLVVALPVFMILLMPLLVAAWTLVSSGDYVTQPSSLKSSPWGVDVATLILGPPYSGIAGAFVRRAYTSLGIDIMESSAWLGLAPILLLLVTLRGGPPTSEVRRWLALAAMFAVWALGPYLDVAGYHSGILLPKALAHLLPFVNNARIPGRAMAVCALALLVAFSVAFSRTPRRPGSLVLIGLIVLAISESIAAPLPLARLDPPGVYADIAAGSNAGSVLTIPFGVRDGFGEKGMVEHDALIGQTVHRRPLVGGFLARLPPRVWSWYEGTEPYRSLLALSSSKADTTPLPSCASVIAGLQAASVAYVVFYPQDAPERLREMITTRMPLRRVAQDERRVLFQVDLTRSGPCGP